MVTATKKRTKKAEPVAHNNGTNITVLRADSLLVDEGYQRPSEGSVKAKRIGGKFDWNKVHIFLVSPRGRGRYACVDGGHRLNGIAVRFPGFVDDRGRDILLRCEVLPKSRRIKGKYASEALSFLGAQEEQSAPNANDAFKARRYAGERSAVRAYQIAVESGITIKFRKSGERFSTGANETKCGGVFYWAHGSLSERKYRFFCRLLNCFVNEDGDIQTKALQGTFLRGLAHFVKTTDITQAEILKSVWSCDSAADIAERAWSKTRSGFQRPKAVSDEIERALLHGLRVK